MPALEPVALEFLTRLESRESELLSWGVVDGYFTKDELGDEAERFLEECDDPDPYTFADDLIIDLLEAALLWELPDEPECYRTRMAEGIRLLFRLRQVLPWRSWDQAPNLVADFRLLLRPRRYPKRYLGPAEVRQRLGWLNLSSLEIDVLNCVVGVDLSHPFELADFQVDSAQRVLDEVAHGRKSGTIVCAGTGSGKTLAFYLPALIALARWADGTAWTRCLSLYPRNELLKDQLSSAVAQVRRVNRVLTKHGRSPIRVGALFGAVPKNCSRGALGKKGLKDWEELRGQGWRCPYLTCPECGARALCWRNADLDAQVERLVCTECSAEVGKDLFVLTRTAMESSPPDLLFTSLEIMNHRMSDPKLGRLLGLGQPVARRPRLVLLDEAHTYEGVYGAQAALLLRRWKERSKAAPHFVGLSATLADAKRFFAEFIAERALLVEELSPTEDDMEPLGHEYLLALRGDPISPTSLLSTSIQTAMLLRRLLDPSDSARDGVYGSKVFGFTDDLDVTNRLFHDLLDAEGWRFDWGGARVPSGGPWLAQFRALAEPDVAQRRRVGQVWDLCEEIGHRLMGPPPVSVARTSSQDAGVEDDAEIVIATASLEVGFDDPNVGAVLQHKAPRTASQFLQRKGRAGRRREMRPWTVVVLSSYGRDRLAYQGYEQLFSPELKARHLPLQNRYVLRIQAVYALLDWLSAQSVVPIDAHLWSLLSQPPTPKFEGWALPRLKKLREVVVRVLDQAGTRRELEHYLRFALGVDESTVMALMWDPPRSLMTAVLPTLARRLDRVWKRATPPGATREVEPSLFWSPLPEFVPRALFSDLNLPEVVVQLDRRPEPETMPILQALREFAPGRVSLRFGVGSREARYWVRVADAADHSDLSIDGFCPSADREDLGVWCYRDGDRVVPVRVLRPFRLLVEEPPEVVQSPSKATLHWHSQFVPAPEPIEVDRPSSSRWDEVLTDVSFFTHLHANPVEVRRFGVGSSFQLSLRGEDDLVGSVGYVAGNPPEPVALGFNLDVDAIRVSVAVPDGLRTRLASRFPGLLRSLRPARFRHLLDGHPDIQDLTNVFQRQWLARLYLAALVLEAEATGGNLSSAHQRVLDKNWQPLEHVLATIFRSLEDTDENEARRGDRRAELRALMETATFRRVVIECAPALWETPDADWEPWLGQRFRGTLAAGLLEACQHLCPELDAGDLCPDIDPGVQAVPREGHEIWLSETTMGGGGFIEGLFDAYTDDPRRFFDLLDAALGSTDHEDVHTELSILLAWAGESTDRGDTVRAGLERVRAARGHSELTEAQVALRRTLNTLGLRTTHSVVTALQARILRPGSSGATDALLRTLLQRWETIEAQTGIEIDAHVLAYLSSTTDELDQALSQLGGTAIPEPRGQWRFHTTYGLLWPRGAAVRSQGLQAYNPYNPLPETDRLLVLAALEHGRPVIALDQADWFTRFEAALVERGVADLVAPIERRRELRDALQRLLVNPVDLGFLHAYPRVRGLTQEGRQLSLTVELAEVVQ